MEHELKISYNEKVYVEAILGIRLKDLGHFWNGHNQTWYIVNDDDFNKIKTILSSFIAPTKYKGGQKRCSACGKPGHYASTCKNTTEHKINKIFEE